MRKNQLNADEVDEQIAEGVERIDGIDQKRGGREKGQIANYISHH